MAAWSLSDWTMQFLADLLGAPVDRPVVQETTALGAAYLAGLQAGLLPPPGPAVRRIGGWNGASRRPCRARGGAPLCAVAGRGAAHAGTLKGTV